MIYHRLDNDDATEVAQAGIVTHEDWTKTITRVSQSDRSERDT